MGTSDEADHIDKIHKYLEESAGKLDSLCGDSLKQYTVEMDKIEDRATSKVRGIRIDLQDVVKVMLEDMEYNKK
eukprot:2313788-Karenia_brevis.AAC.1